MLYWLAKYIKLMVLLMGSNSFSITQTSPFSWKNDLLAVSDNKISIVKPGLSTSLLALVQQHSLSIAKVREAFQQERDTVCQQKDLTLVARFNCNNNLQCLNEKIARVNAKQNDPTQHIKPLELLALPPLKATVSRKDDSNAPSAKDATEWVTKQHASFQPIAYVLARAALNSYVPKNDFKIALQHSVEAAKEKIENRPFGVVTWEKPRGSSGPYVESLAKLFGKPGQRLKIVSHDLMETAEFTELTESKKTTTSKKVVKAGQKVLHWILFDDAIYSSNQLRSTVLPSVMRHLTSKYEGSKLQLHLVIPYASDAGKKKVDAYWKQEWKDHTLHFSNFCKMDTIQEIAKRELTEEHIVAGIALADCADEEAPKCITYFWDKVGDAQSFPLTVVDGYIKTRTYKHFESATFKQYKEAAGNVKTVNSHSFIPAIKPPYRKV
jgi:hypothetical protein